MARLPGLLKSNLDLAHRAWEGVSDSAAETLKELTRRYRLSVASGDLQFLDQRWYVTHSGMLRIAHSRRCHGVRTILQTKVSDPAAGRWVFKAIVYKTAGSKGFMGYGDADPSNVSPLVRGAEMRVAETRAVNRALRKAYAVSVGSLEELPHVSSPPERAPRKVEPPATSNGNGHGNGQPRLRDRLCLLIRQHQLDPALVKRYAADFCGTQELREASRELVESFITTLADQAAKDRDGLICKLNSYGHTKAVKS